MPETRSILAHLAAYLLPPVILTLFQIVLMPRFSPLLFNLSTELLLTIWYLVNVEMHRYTAWVIGTSGLAGAEYFGDETQDLLTPDP